MRHIVMLVANSVNSDPRVRKEATTLTSRGDNVVVFGLQEPTDIPSTAEPPPFRVELLSEPLWPILHWIVRRVGRLSWGLRGAETDGSEEEERAGPSLPEEAPSGWISAVRSLNAFLRFRAGERSFRSAADDIAELDPDIVHAHDLNTLRPAAEISRRCGASLVYDSHEIFSEVGAYHPLYRRWLRSIEAKALRTSSPAIITVSPSIARWFSREYSVPEPTVVPNTPPKVDVVPRHELVDQPRSREDEPIRFLYQGGLSPRRGILPLVHGFLEMDGDVELLVRGPGRLREYLASLLQEHGTENVHLLPPVRPDELVSAAARDADVGVVPFVPHSLNYRYALPNKLFEYLAAGLAVLSSDLVEIRRLNVQFQFGELYQPADQHSLIRAVERLAGDRDRLARLQRQAYRAHRESLNWEQSSEVLLELYRQIAPTR